MGKFKTARVEQEEAREEEKRQQHVSRKAERKLKDTLSNSIRAVSSLFELWDVNGDGQVSPDEFARAIAALGVSVSPKVCNKVFEEFDPDNSGTVSYIEFLRFALRDALAKSATRVMDFFTKADSDDSGQIGLKEFLQAVAGLGYDVPREHLETMFAEIDVDGSGSVSFKELNKQLRQGASIKLSKKLQVGGAGKIRTKTTERLLEDPYESKAPAPHRSDNPERVAGRPTTAPVPKALDEKLTQMLGPRAAAPLPDLVQRPTTVHPLLAGASEPTRASSMFKLTIAGSRNADTAMPPSAWGSRSQRLVKPGGGGGPRSAEGRFFGYAASGMVVCDQPRRRMILDEKAEVARQRAKGLPLVYPTKTLPSYSGPRWTEPVPAIAYDELNLPVPTLTWSYGRIPSANRLRS